ncbi:hypothetical protein [Stutzerimonas nitrititolerans]|uniref:hypothetical protein n=1 Tax=Stutzerimonas nitrititolerans TaxID=2482751 RepID=UPI0028AB6B51|nr:hypothetical protein [Stutzerimonas nitrititolerans]
MESIEAVKVERDEYGHWTHPAWPSNDDEYIQNSWFDDQGLELKVVDFEGDAAQELVDAYFESGEPDCSKWEPTVPDGEGWFVFSIHDTEDGPICVWVRRR